MGALAALLALPALAGDTESASGTSRQCETPYAEHGVYETLIVYLIDEIVEGPGFLPIDSDRNTFAYRESAYHFFRERFGLDFDPGNPDLQVISGPDGDANVFPLKTGEGSTHQVYGIDAQNVPQWRHKMPMTRIALFDDGYFVTLDSDYVVRGTYGGEDGNSCSASTACLTIAAGCSTRCATSPAFPSRQVLWAAASNFQMVRCLSTSPVTLRATSSARVTFARWRSSRPCRMAVRTSIFATS